MLDLGINLLASVIAGAAVWAAQKLVRHRRLQRKRAFFGLSGGAECLLVVPKHVSAKSNSVNRSDVAALVELSGVAKECGALPNLVMHDQDLRGVGDKTEFCVGGPSANQRTAAHLRWLLRGVDLISSGPDDPYESTIRIGTDEFVRVQGVYEYVVVAKVFGPDAAHPVFVFCGQTAYTNHAAARYLAKHYRQLLRSYGTDPFCIVLRIVDPTAYGNNVVELVKDLTGIAMTPPAGSLPKADRSGEADDEPVGTAKPARAARAAVAKSSTRAATATKVSTPSRGDAAGASDDPATS